MEGGVFKFPGHGFPLALNTLQSSKALNSKVKEIYDIFETKKIYDKF